MSGFKRTAGQYAAAQPDRSVWVSANAGTGKTRVLVDRIARLLLDGAQPEKILCLTFTKTAAAEMSERINTQLGHWAVMDDKALVEDIRLLSQREPDDAMLQTARRLFARVLDVPGGLKIRTIHSFCESLIARFPIEAGVAPHFSVIDERTTAELLSEARERLLEQTVHNPDTALARAVEAIAELIAEDDFASLIQDLAGNRARLKDVLTHFERQGGIAPAVTALVGLGQHETDAATIVRDADARLDGAALLSATEALARGAKTSQTLAAEIKAYVNSPDRAARFESDYAPLFVTTTGEARKKLTTKGAEAAEDTLRAEQDRVMGVLEKLKARATADATAHLLTVGSALLNGYERLKQVRAHLDYDDLIDTARALLASDGGVSWVHFKLDGGIDHILVDESQDTSPAQWDIVGRIAAEFFTGLGAHEDHIQKTEHPHPRTVFAVGDEKQSIYSFQGADPHEFGRMKEHFQARVQSAGERFSSVPLTTSFRTTRAVLRVVDRVFANPQAADGLTFAGERVAHDSHRLGEAGLVEVWPTVKPLDKSDADPWDAPLDYVSEERAEMRLARDIADTVKGWIDGQEILPSQNRPVAAGDVLILVRRRARFAEEMVRQLKSRGIPVAGADRMVLTEQIAVMDLLSAGRFAVLPEDDLTLAEVLKSPLIGFDEQQLFDLAHDRKASLWAELKRRRDDHAHFAHAHDALAKLLAAADFMPPYEFYAGLLRDSGRLALTRRLGVDAEDPIDEFLALALDFERNHTPSLQGFLHWVTATQQQIKRDMEVMGNQVRVMTVHGAKGLEANIVFLTDTCTTPDGRLDGRVQWLGGRDAATPPGMLWAPHKDARCQAFQDQSERQREEREREYRRLLYVAMTRAKDRLYITGYEDSRGRADGCWYDLIQPVVQELGTEIPHPSGEPAWRYETAQEVDAKKAAVQAMAQPHHPLPDWALSPPPSEDSPPKPLSPSRPEPEAPPALGPFDGDKGARFKRGLLVHKLLETLPSLAHEKRRTAAEQWLARPAHGLDSETQADIVAETLNVLDHPDFAPLFGPDSLAEVSLSGVINARVVSARLDRLLVCDDAVWVIDYKTNRPAPTDPARVPEQYLAQMATYRELLARIYPDKQVRCVLLWTDGPHVMELNDDILRTYGP
ncbi:double-strand break repair helicase AddA [Magnetovibrio sp.]|uniref:double-strand break repair helicase AddA n=1 Tax=Magnetovibrio sp. TaxID=2024836 RepID=UPI002F93DE77